MRVGLAGREWRIRARASDEELERSSVGPPLLAQLLLNRGLVGDEAERFLEAADASLCDPLSMAGVQAAVERLRQALSHGEPIGIYGDYDVDGLSGTALLYRALTALGGRVVPYIPHRDADGYGVSDGGLRQLQDAGAKVVVTVDCGIGAREEVALASRSGLDVIVTDHHLVPAELPEAVAVLNPRQPGCEYACKDLSGAGVALALMRALLEEVPPRSGRVALEWQLVQLAALGAIADMVPLLGENRTIVSRGLAALRTAPLIGLRELISATRRKLAATDAETISFVVAPRLNAAGRMGSARPALDLLITNDAARAVELAAELEDLNRQRQLGMKEHLAVARAAAAPHRGRSSLVVAGDFPMGIVGLLAGQLAEEHGCPTVVLRVADGVARGSARGPEDVNLVELLGANPELLHRFGGHARAAGLTLDASNIPAFEEAFHRAAEQLALDNRPTPILDVDCALVPASISVSTLRTVERLQPFGLANVRPVFVTRALCVRSARVVGADHVRLQLSREDRSFRAIAFNRAADAPAPGSELDVVFHLKSDDWDGRTDVELEVLDWRQRAVRNQNGSAGYTPTERASI